MPTRLSKHIRNKTEELLFNVGDMALKRRAKSVIQALDLKNGENILDAGCGDGFYLHLLSNLGINLKLTGIDVDARGLESARKHLGTSKIPLVCADLMQKIPFSSNNFDGVVISEVAEHLQNDVRGLKEIYRVLKPGGVLALTVPCKNYPLLWDPVNWLLEHLFNTHIKSGFWAGIWSQHIRLYSLEQINLVLRSAGFTVEQSEIQTFWCIPFNHYILNIGARLLTSNRLPNLIGNSASKFSESPVRNINPISIFFATVNFIDKLNKVLPIKSSGISIFVRAKK